MDSVEVQSRGRKAEQSAATRAALIAAARRLFGERGYPETSTEEIVEKARVTRGALYHHFRDKADIFAAAYEEIQREILDDILRAAATGGDDWIPRLQAAVQAYLDFYMDAGRRRIVLVDAPAVLAWEARNQIHLKLGLGNLRMALQMMMEAGAIQMQPAQSLAHVIHGALNEGAMAIACAENIDSARTEVGASIARLVAGLAIRDPARD